MVAKHEIRKYGGEAQIYLAKYMNLNNILHWHYDCELVYVASGCLEIYTGGKNYILNGGQTMYIGNMEEHYIKTQSETLVYMFIFSYDMLRGLTKNLRLKSPVLKNGYDLITLYETVKTELLKKEKYYERVVENLIADIIIRIFRGEEVVKAEFKKKDKMAFMRLLDDIEVNYCFYTGDDAASFLHLSKVYFSKYFHLMSGMVFSDYLNAVRISKAVEILRGDKEKTIAEVASECGFNTIRNFNRAFKQLTGFSPSEIPEGYAVEDAVFFSSGSAAGFNPTLRQTVLLESVGDSVAD